MLKKPKLINYTLPIMAMVAVITASNVLVQYPLNDWLTWGAFTYPMAFLVTDITNRFYGRYRAQVVAGIGFPFGMFLSVFLSLHADFDVWTSIRIALASGFAFICAQLLDIFVFDKLRRMSWWRAPLISSVLASALDTLIFFSVAFAGSGLPWITWGLGDFGVKIGMALMMLVPFRIFIELLRIRNDQASGRDVA